MPLEAKRLFAQHYYATSAVSRRFLKKYTYLRTLLAVAVVISESEHLIYNYAKMFSARLML